MLDFSYLLQLYDTPDNKHRFRSHLITRQQIHQLWVLSTFDNVAIRRCYVVFYDTVHVLISLAGTDSQLNPIQCIIKRIKKSSPVFNPYWYHSSAIFLSNISIYCPLKSAIPSNKTFYKSKIEVCSYFSIDCGFSGIMPFQSFGIGMAPFSIKALFPG